MELRNGVEASIVRGDEDGAIVPERAEGYSMRHPLDSCPPNVLRGGDEGDLIKQAVLLELFEVLTEQKGEFWYLAAGVEPQEGSRMADMPALDWFAVAEGAQGRHGWGNFPLWEVQRPWLGQGEFLSTNAMALCQLSRWFHRGVTGRVVLGEREPQRLRRLESFLYAGRGVEAEWDQDEWPFRVYQMVGDPTQTLRDMAYGGIVRGPGVACLHLPESLQYAGSWLTLIETLLLRQIWVLVTLPTSWFSGRELLRKSSYSRLRDGVTNLQFPGLSFRLKGRNLSWKPNAGFELWVLSPEQEFETFVERAERAVQRLLVDGLGRTLQRGKVQGLQTERLFDTRSKLNRFFSLLPQNLPGDIRVEVGQERDLPEVVRLWEQLMDEHASFDHHFRRRALSGLYLRQSLMAQLTQPEHLLLVVRRRGQAVGFLTAQVLRAPLFHTSRIGQIVDVFLLPEHRSQGMGEKLVELSMEWFVAMDLSQIDLNVAIDNVVGQGFWKKHGFRPYLNVVSRFVKG